MTPTEVTKSRLARREALHQLQPQRWPFATQSTPQPEHRTCLGCGARHPINPDGTPVGGDTTEEHIKTRACFERLAGGTADNDDFDRVAMALNLAKVRALEIDQALADLLEAGQNAMATIGRRHGKWAKWDVLPAERTAIVEALDAHEVITDASSPLQMLAALDVVRRAIRKQGRAT